jgi:pheromone shutdown protein TraB
MFSAITSAKEINAKIALIDRDINVTLLKLTKNLTFKEKFKILFSGFFVPKKDLKKINIDSILKEVEEGKENSDMIEQILQIFTEQHKKLKEILIDQRDQYMAYQLQNMPGENIVVVVGAGHVNGIINNLNNKEIDIKKILTI